MPDYPTDWNNNYYDSIYSGGYGWWVAERHLSTDESSFALSKMKYKLTAKPSAPMTMKWCEVFVPDDDPATPDVDESRNIKIVAEHTWILGAGQNESSEYEIDPTTRSDGNGYYTLMIEPVHLSTWDLGEAGKNVSGQETDPGKVVLVNDGDADNDGIPDYGDGYRLHDDVDDEANSYSTSFTPLYINWAAVDPKHAKIKFTYDASGPLGVTRSGSNFYVLPDSGKLRIWTKDGWKARNGHDAKQGGDFIKPGVEYLLQDFFGPNPNYYWYGGMTFYVEAVKTSGGIADLPVKVEIDPTGTSGFPWSDQLRFTATKIELRGKQYGEQDFSPVNHLINSTLDQFDPTIQMYDTTPASYEVHRVRLYDPRATAITRVKVGSTYLPVTRNGSYLETGDFVCIQPGTTPTNWTGGATLVPMAGSSFDIEYNPFSVVDWVCGFRRSPDQAKAIQDQVDKVTRELHDDTTGSWKNKWITPDGGFDQGMFGKEVHARVQTHFTSKPGWYADVYIKKSTGEIFSVGEHLPRGTLPKGGKGLMQIDLLYCKGGYKINTGARAFLSGRKLEVLNKSGLLFASEIKTAARLRKKVLDEIVENYRLVTGLPKGAIHIADSEYVFKGESVVFNKIKGRALRLMGIAGGFGLASLSLASAAVDISQAESMLDDTMQTVIRDRDIFLDPTTLYADAEAAKFDAATAISQWMHLVIPNDVAYGLASLPLYTWVYADTPPNQLWVKDPIFDEYYDSPDDDDLSASEDDVD